MLPACSSASKFPRRHILGNHDLEFMTAEEGEELLGVSMLSESIDVNGYHLVFWQADTY